MATTTNQTALQRYQVTQVAGGPVGVARQALHEVIAYSVEYSGWLAAGDTIQSVLVDIGPQTIPALEVVNTLVVDQNAVQFSVRKGVDDTAYNIVFTIQTQTGQTKQDVLELTVGERDDYSGPTSSRVFDKIAIGADLDARFKLFAYLNDAKILARPQSDGGTGDARYFLDREDIDTEAAVYHQTGGTSHARTGLLHDDSSSAPNAYFIQVSDDGVNWKTGLEIDAATGRVKFPAGVTLPNPGPGVLGGVMTEPGRDNYYVRGLGSDGRLILTPFLPPTPGRRGVVYSGGPEFNKYVSAITTDGKVQLTAFDPPTSTKLGMVFAGQATVGQVCMGIGWDGKPIFGSADGAYIGVFPTHPGQADIHPSQWPLRPGSIYFNSTSNKPFIWTGSAWTVFWAPEKASTATLYYLSTAGQTAFPMGTLDLLGNSFAFDAADPEAVEVYLNGVRLMPPYGPTGALGDYTIDTPNNVITLSEALPGNAVVTIDLLTPTSKLAPGSVTIYPVFDLNIDPKTNLPGLVDGVRTSFTMFKADGATPVNASGAEHIFVSVDGVIQQPYTSYKASGASITFTSPPAKDSVIWAIWLKPGAGGSGAGVNPPMPPADAHSNRYGWLPGTGGVWDDDRGDMHSVANAAARLALKDPEEIIPGSMVYERDTHDIWVYTPTPANDPTLTASWTMALKGHPTDNIMRSLDYDPSKPNSMAWEDNRDEMETVNAVADLNNRAVLPLSHLAVGKLVYVRATGELWECLVDGTTGTITNTFTDWKQLGGGLKYVGRAGNLPASGIPDGALYIIGNAANGNPAYNRLVAWDAVNSAWVYPTTRNYMHATSADPQDAGDVDGDLQITYENGHALLEAWDVANTAWHTIYSEDTVKQWIAASNLFQGTVEDRGHGTVGAIDLNVMKAQSALGVTDAGHYWIYVGLAGHVVTPNEIGGSASNIDGAKLNVGDWLLVANTGTAAAPVMKYTHIPGDLLAKSRGDGLYGLNAYAPGAYEIGSLVVSGGDIYKASRAVLLADPAPGATGAPWVKVDISGGVKTVAADSNLPTAAPNGAVYLVLSSAQAGGKGALYMRDNPSSKWQALGGGGVPLSLGGGKKIVNVGVPVGTVIDYAGKTLPAGYLLCDGSTFDATVYPQLNTALGGNRLPDLRNQFVRGANTMAEVSFVKHDATTGMPKTHFTGVTNSTGAHTHTTDNPGDHRHNVDFSMSNHNWKGGGGWTGDATVNFAQDGGSASSANGGHTHTTTSAGAHTHTIEIQSGGDPETAPAHVILAKIIKADDVGALAI